MRKLWREAGVAALVCGALAACASPAYPINDGDAAGAAPLTMGRPAYPIADSAPQAAAVQSRPAALAPDDGEASGPPLAAPTPKVDSQPLPSPGTSASISDDRRADGARLQYASMTGEAPAPAAAVATSPAAAPKPAASTAGATTPAPASPAPDTTDLPPPAPAAAPATPTPAPAAETTPVAPAAAAAAAQTALTPRQVVHDQTAPMAAPVARTPPVREAIAAPPSTRSTAIPSAADPSLSITGDVVAASGGLFQNYEVQGGDHVDQLARAFSTSRQTLLEANHMRAPFVIHPGQIVKVPVAKAYVARSGDSLQGVARRFSVSLDELADLNHISARAGLRPGQEIGLPSSMRDRGPLRISETQYAAAPSPAYRAPAYRPPPQSHMMTPDTGTRYSGQIPAGQASPQPPRPTYGYQTSQPPAYAAQAAPALMSDTEIAQAARGRFVWPLRGDMMVRFGSQGVGKRNDGIDIRASQGTPVKAAAAGEVVYAGNQVPGFGNLVLIKHADGWVTAYAHLDQLDVQMKQQVAQGQAVGVVGVTGGAPEPELHFEVRYAPTPADKARPVDPVLVLPLG